MTTTTKTTKRSSISALAERLTTAKAEPAKSTAKDAAQLDAPTMPKTSALHVADAKRSKAIEAGRAKAAKAKPSTAPVESLPTLNPASQVALDRAVAGNSADVLDRSLATIDAEVKAANARIAAVAASKTLKAGKALCAALALETTPVPPVKAPVVAAVKVETALDRAHAQMADDGCPNECLVKPGQERRPPLAGKASLPRSAPGRELAVPTAKPAAAKTPQTKAEQQAAAKTLGLQVGKNPPKKAAGKNKSAIVQEMLERGTTQAEMSAITGWPNTNLKTAAARAAKLGLPSKLVEKDGKLRFVK